MNDFIEIIFILKKRKEIFIHLKPNILHRKIQKKIIIKIYFFILKNFFS
jgi:hypothetical protein